MGFFFTSMDYYTRALHYSQEDYTKQGWSTQAQQEVRFLIFMDFIRSLSLDQSHLKLLDFGCGFGDWIHFGNKQSDFSFEYHGIDAHAQMIREAKIRHPQHRFTQGSWHEITEEYDLILASGVFNVREYWQEEDVDKCIKKLYNHSRKAFIFNMLKIHEPLRDLQGFDPEKRLTKIQSFCPKAQLRSDYFPQDFTLFLPHEKHPSSRS